MNKLILGFLFKNPCKDLRLTLIMKNKEKTDIRRYRMEITVYPKPVKATIEFKVPLRNLTI